MERSRREQVAVATVSRRCCVLRLVAVSAMSRRCREQAVSVGGGHVIGLSQGMFEKSTSGSGGEGRRPSAGSGQAERMEQCLRWMASLVGFRNLVGCITVYYYGYDRGKANLEQIAEAHRYVETGQKKGTVVKTMVKRSKT